jgi:hypothetical protein
MHILSSISNIEFFRYFNQWLNDVKCENVEPLPNANEGQNVKR